jgi:hypothetical protein
MLNVALDPPGYLFLGRRRFDAYLRLFLKTTHLRLYSLQRAYIDAELLASDANEAQLSVLNIDITNSVIFTHKAKCKAAKIASEKTDITLKCFARLRIGSRLNQIKFLIL